MNWTEHRTHRLDKTNTSTTRRHQKNYRRAIDATDGAVRYASTRKEALDASPAKTDGLNGECKPSENVALMTDKRSSKFTYDLHICKHISQLTDL